MYFNLQWSHPVSWEEMFLERCGVVQMGLVSQTAVEQGVYIVVAPACSYVSKTEVTQRNCNTTGSWADGTDVAEMALHILAAYVITSSKI